MVGVVVNCLLFAGKITVGTISGAISITADAFNNLSDIDWAQGAGLGVRYYTPVGPIKVDLARQIGEPNPSWRLHVSVGFAW